jgi:hypothetical protein
MLKLLLLPMYYVQQLPLNYNVNEDQASHGLKLSLKPCWSSMTIKHFLELVGYKRTRASIH